MELLAKGPLYRGLEDPKKGTTPVTVWFEIMRVNEDRYRYNICRNLGLSGSENEVIMFGHGSYYAQVAQKVCDIASECVSQDFLVARCLTIYDPEDSLQF
jgi:hypothetical protein